MYELLLESWFGIHPIFKELNCWELIRKIDAICIIHIASAKRFYDLIEVDSIDFGQHKTEEEIFYYCGKIILYNKVTGALIIGYIINEDDITMDLVTKGGKKINLIKSTYHLLICISYGSGLEYYCYSFQFTEDCNYDVVEYYSIHIIISRN